MSWTRTALLRLVSIGRRNDVLTPLSGVHRSGPSAPPTIHRLGECHQPGIASGDRLTRPRTRMGT
jgi:hypothetical protein